MLLNLFLLLMLLVNGARAEAGLRPLDRNLDWERAADARSLEMAEQGWFHHNLDAWRFDLAHDIAGEDIARNNYPGELAGLVAFQGFMQSPSHRAILLADWGTGMGIGVREQGGFYYFTILVCGGC